MLFGTREMNGSAQSAQPSGSNGAHGWSLTGGSVQSRLMQTFAKSDPTAHLQVGPFRLDHHDDQTVHAQARPLNRGRVAEHHELRNGG
jgi:hypothetical protein